MMLATFRERAVVEAVMLAGKISVERQLLILQDTGV